MNALEVPRWPALAGVAAMLGSVAVGIVAVLLVAGPAAVLGASRTGLVAVLVVSLLTAAGTLALVHRLAALTRPPEPAQFGLGMPSSPGMALLALALAALLLAALCGAWALAGGFAETGDVPPEVDPRGALGRGFDQQVPGGVPLDAALALSAFARVVLPAVVAEILLRGFVLPALSSWRGPWVAGAIVAVLFGGAAGLGTDAALVVPGIALGALLCALYAATGSLLPGIALSAAASGALFGAACDLSSSAMVLVAAICAIVAVATVLPVARPRASAPVAGALRPT